MYKLSAILFLLFTSFATMAQTTKDKIENAYKDPDREKNSARADVYAAGKQKIMDTTTIQKAKPVPVEEEPAIKRRKPKKSSGKS